MNLLLALKFFLMSVFGLCLTLLVIIPVLSPFLLVFLVWYLLVKIILKIKYGDDVYKANGTDVTHGRQTSESLPVINAAVRVTGDCNIERIKEKMLNMIENTRNSDGHKRYKRLKELYGRKYGYNVFRKYAEFDINKHVRLVDLDDEFMKPDNKLQNIPINVNNQNCYLEMNKIDPELQNVSHQTVNDFSNQEENDQTKGRSQLKSQWSSVVKRLLNKYGAQPFPAELPPWNILAFDEGNGKYTVLLRFHHAISDGIYFSRMFSEDILDESVKVFQSYQPPHKCIRWMTSFWSFCLLPFGLWQMVSNTDSNPLHGPKLTGKKLFYISNSLPLETFYLIKKKIKVSLHSIICSCISYAVSSHFQRRGCSIPAVNALSPLPLQNPHKQIKLKNKFAVALMKLPTPQPQRDANWKPKITADSSEWHQQTTSLMRLTQVQATLNEMAQSPALLAVNTVITIMCSLLPEALVKMLLSVKGCTMALSNLPGVKVQSKIWNGILDDQIFWIPDRDPLGVGFSILSYNGNLRIGLILDEALLQNELEGDEILEDFEKGLGDIIQELNPYQDMKLGVECLP